MFGSSASAAAPEGREEGGAAPAASRSYANGESASFSQGAQREEESASFSSFTSPAANAASTTPASLPSQDAAAGAEGAGARAEGIRALEEQVQSLDSDWDELQKLQYMTEEAAYSMVQSGSPHAGGPGGPGDAAAAAGNAQNFAAADTDEVDRRSVYVGNVDYSSTPAELQEHFKSCGTINRITIMVDKYTGHPKGYAYIEFNSEAAVQNALLLSDTVFKQRQIKVVAKRKNIPGFARGRGGWRGARMAGAGMMMGRGGRGTRGGFRPIYRPRGGFARGYGRPY
ncbi:RNA recognition motif-containing protein [Besnoitia besnoiti]|uniref:RNA recognition motif-containing protein n=1 Tax=Besnoitia besnoiti TaxID=94643 RepID=A0A2A9M7P0_BESBE|nr:RNA recognition motif-containing protein [Besnoitia besnoiti]PFH32311.1 RNA recognition motif-containing protein [Besnoitia besnoiti]